MLLQRLVSIPLFLVLALLLTGAAPLLFPLTAFLSLLPATRGALRIYCFALGASWVEIIGLLRLGLAWVTSRHSPSYISINQRIQVWWAGALLALGQRTFDVSFDTHGEEALEGSPAIVLPRHTTIADTVLPIVLYSAPRDLGVRYVLKQELLWGPCLNIAGHRIPNYFVDRSGQDTERAVKGLSALVASAGDDVVVFYPEGTRLTQAKRDALYAKNNALLTQHLDRWPSLMPPRIAGTKGLLAANPGKDLLFLFHSGLEPSASFGGLLRGDWNHAKITLVWWRVPFSDVPVDADDRERFFFQQWDKMESLAAEYAIINP